MDRGPCSRMTRLRRPRAGRPVKMLVRRVLSSRAFASAARCSGRCRRLRRAKKGRADLHRVGAERECGLDAPSVRDAAGGDNRHLHGIAHLRQQREKSRLPIRVARQEHGAMAARFLALCDHRISAMRFEPARFGHRRRGRQNHRAGLLDAREQGGRRHAEMKRDDGRLRFFNDGAERLVERIAHDTGFDLRRIDALFAVIGRERRAPGMLRSFILRGSFVTEEVDVQRSIRRRANDCDLLTQLRGGDHRRRE